MLELKVLAVILVLGAVFAAGWVVSDWRMSGKLESLRGDLAQARTSASQWEAAAGLQEQAVGALRATVAEQNAEVEKLRRQERATLELLHAAAEDSAREREAWQRRLQEATRPLPSDCPEAVAEAVRRIQEVARAPR